MHCFTFFHVSNFRAITKPEVGEKKENAAIREAVDLFLYPKPETGSWSDFIAAHSDVTKRAENLKNPKLQSSHVNNSASFERKYINLKKWWGVATTLTRKTNCLAVDLHKLWHAKVPKINFKLFFSNWKHHYRKYQQVSTPFMLKNYHPASYKKYFKKIGELATSKVARTFEPPKITKKNGYFTLNLLWAELSTRDVRTKIRKLVTSQPT